MNLILFDLALVGYLLATVLALVHLVQRQEAIYRLAVLVTLAGWVLHTLALVVRGVELGRPPLGTLVEAMSSGLPIACSDRGPMPEILGDGGVYFDPENPDSIAAAIESIILKQDMRIFIASRAEELSKQYSWARCKSETFGFLRACIETSKHNNQDNNKS